MNTQNSPQDYLITDVSIFTFTYSHDYRASSLLEWDKLANQEEYFPNYRIEIPGSLLEMAVEAPQVMEALMLSIKPSLQHHGFQEARHNLYEAYTSFPKYEANRDKGPLSNIDYNTWRYLVKHSYGIPFTEVHPLQVQYMQELFEAIIVGKRMSAPIKRDYFGFAPRPFRGCLNLLNYGLYPLQKTVESIPVIRMLGTVLGAVLFYGPDIGFRALGHVTATQRESLSRFFNRTSSQLRNQLSSYFQRKKQVAADLLSRDIDRVILAIPGVLVGLSAIMVVATEPMDWTAAWFKNSAEALAGIASGAVIAIDGKYLSEKWGWSRR